VTASRHAFVTAGTGRATRFSTNSMAGGMIAASHARFPGIRRRAGVSIRSCIAMLALAALIGGVPAFAQQKGGKPARTAPPPPQQMSLEQAVKQVQHQTNGRILAADTIPRGQTKLYRIKVLTPQGHVRVMQLHSNEPAKPQPRHDERGGH